MMHVHLRQAIARRGSVRRLVAGSVALATLTATATVATVTAPIAANAINPGVITSAGPLTTIGIQPQLNCYTRRTGDTDGEWYDGSDIAGSSTGDDACGTFAVVNGALYGPASVPAGDSATSAETAPWTAVSQTAATGTGTATSPYTVVTVVAAGATGVTVTETDTYVTGQEGYATYISAANSSAAPVALTIYHAGDCYLQNDDHGFGVLDASDGAAGCQAETLPPPPSGTGHVRGTRVEQLFPLTPGSAYLEDFYATVWSNIGAKTPFPNTCVCDTTDADFIDNGVGLSWVVPALAPSATVQEGVYTSLSPTGIVPATTGNVADAASVLTGGADAYTVTVRNSGASAIHLVGVTDQLPAGFTYTAGSTTGLTATNPTISGQSLTWSVPSTVIAPAGSASLHFGFTASTTPGDYINLASGIATETAVVPAGPFAPLHVIQPPGAPTSVSTLGGRKAVQVSWVAPTVIGNSAITGYDVQITPTGKAATIASFDASVATRIIGGLADNTGYSFQVRAKNAAGAGAWSAAVVIAGTKISTHAVVSIVTLGGSRTLAATLTSGGRALGGARVALFVRRQTKLAFTLVKTVTTKANGVATVGVKPARGSVYEWVYTGDAGHLGSVADRALFVSPKITLDVSGHVSRFSVAVASGKVSPVFAKQLVYLQKLSGKHWVNVAATKLSKSGSYAFALNTNTSGTVVYRVAKGHSGDYITGFSPLKAVTVS